MSNWEKRRKDNIKNSPNHYETHTRPYVEKLVEDFINKNQIMAYYGKDDTGVFEVRFSVKEQPRKRGEYEKI